MPTAEFRPLPYEDAEFRRCLMLDFGRRDVRAPGAVAVSTTFNYAEAVWAEGLVRNRDTYLPIHPFIATGVEGHRATFLLGLEPRDDYRIAIVVGDPLEPRGPIEVSIPGSVTWPDVTTDVGEVAILRARIAVPDGILRIRFRSSNCKPFTAAGMALYVPSTASLEGIPQRPLFAPLPPSISAGDISRGRSPLTDADLQDALRATCDYFLENELQDAGFSRSGLWFQNGYAVRTLFAGASLLEEPRYAAAAHRVVNRFVSEIDTEGMWSAHYFGAPECTLPGSINRTTDSANLADVGVMATATVVAARSADPQTRERYLAAARNFADAWSLTNQLPDGAFPNLRFAGEDHRFPYSVATGTQATFLAALHGLSGDSRYAVASERAARFLAERMEGDGRLRFHPHDSERVSLAGAARMGDAFYAIEGMLAARPLASPEGRAVIDQALDRFMRGTAGLLVSIRDDQWWTQGDTWERSKRAGALYLWALYNADRSPRATDDAQTRVMEWVLVEDTLRAHLGFRTDPGSPHGRHAVPASGFGGIGLAARLQPGLALP